MSPIWLEQFHLFFGGSFLELSSVLVLMLQRELGSASESEKKEDLVEEER